MKRRSHSNVRGRGGMGKSEVWEKKNPRLRPAADTRAENDGADCLAFSVTIVIFALLALYIFYMAKG